MERPLGPPVGFARRTGHHGDALVVLLLVVGFFLGPMKLMGGGWLAYLVPDTLAVLIILVVSNERTGKGIMLFSPSPLTRPLLLLAAYCVLELVNPEAPLIRSVLGLRSWLLYLGLYFVGLNMFRSLQQLQRLYSLLLALGVITALYGVHQWHAGPQSFANWSEHYARYADLAWSGELGLVFRAFSTFVAPGVFSGNMAVVMSLALSVAVSPAITLFWRLLSVAAFAIMGAGIAVSGSRAPVVHLVLMGALIPVLLPGFWSKIGTGIKTAVVVGAALVLLAQGVGPVVSERFATLLDIKASSWIWLERIVISVEWALSHPMGMGLGYTAGVPRFLDDPILRGLPTINIDSGYGSVAFELGLLGLVLFTHFAVKVGVEGVRAWRRLPSSRLKDLLLGPALWAGTYPIFSVVAQPQASLPSSIYFWLLIGMLMKASAPQRLPHANQLLRPKVYPRK